MKEKSTSIQIMILAIFLMLFLLYVVFIQMNELKNNAINIRPFFNVMSIFRDDFTRSNRESNDCLNTRTAEENLTKQDSGIVTMFDLDGEV